MGKHPSINVSLSPSVCIVGALTLLILPLEWILAALTAAVFHECCHIAALYLFHVRIFGISVGSGGTRIETEPMGRWQELCCAVAGPLGSLLLLILIRRCPMVSICALIQGLYNLLPIYPLDGGRVVRCLSGEKTANTIGFWTMLLLSLLGVYVTIRLKLGIGAMILLLLLVRRKIPCKDGPQAVQ